MSFCFFDGLWTFYVCFENVFFSYDFGDCQSTFWFCYSLFIYYCAFVLHRSSIDTHINVQMVAHIYSLHMYMHALVHKYWRARSLVFHHINVCCCSFFFILFSIPYTNMSIHMYICRIAFILIFRFFPFFFFIFMHFTFHVVFQKTMLSA